MKAVLTLSLSAGVLLLSTSLAIAQMETERDTTEVDSTRTIIINNYYYGGEYPMDWGYYYYPGYVAHPFFVSLSFAVPFHHPRVIHRYRFPSSHRHFARRPFGGTRGFGVSRNFGRSRY